MTMELTNKKAVSAIWDDGDRVVAQTMFRQNVKKFPCFITIHNLGVYYLTEEMELLNGKSRGATRQGIKLLLQANALNNKSAINLSALGVAYFGYHYYGRPYLNNKDYPTALKYFKEACDIEQSYIRYYNLGVAYYATEKFESAAQAFKNALHLYGNGNENYFEAPHMEYAFSVLHTNKKQAHDILVETLSNGYEFHELDQFVLAYLCEDHKLAFDLLEKMLSEWHIPPEVIAMVFDCCYRTNNQEKAKIILTNQIEMLKGYNYNVKPEISKCKKAFNESYYRKKLINSYDIKFPLVEECYYIV